MRKSIFEIASASINIPNEVCRIMKMASEEKFLYYASCDYALFRFVNLYCFQDWSQRSHFLDVNDFLRSINVNAIQEKAKNGDVDSFMTLIELVYNFWYLAYQELTEKNSPVEWDGNFYHLRDVMTDNLEKYNHKAFIEDDFVLVIEDKPEVTAVAELVGQDLAVDVIRYNHRALQGELKLKKNILLSLASNLEPRRLELQTQNKRLADDLFFLLNNLDIRHNNRSKRDKNYKEYVAKMKSTRLEQWYDEVYQMVLLSYLLLDNSKRAKEVKALKAKILGEAADHGQA